MFEINGSALIEREQGKLRDRIGAVILLQHVDRVFARRIAQDDRIGFEVHGDVVHVDQIFAGFQFERDLLADHGEILVIDGERRLRGLLRIQAATEDQKTDEASVHEG